MKKTETNDGKKGGLLKGKPHYDKDGNSLGGIKAIVVDSGKPVELEGGEVIINKEASKKYWKELSKINQSAGNGVPILPPNKYDEDPTEYKDGGRVIDFNPNHVPSKRIINYAKTIKQKHPKIWDLGGNIFGNEAFVNLERVSKRGYWLESEEWMYIKWRSYVARHQHDFRIEGVIAMLKWADIVNKGWAYMKDLIEAKIEKTTKMKKGGAVTETYKQQYNQKYNYKPNESHSLEEIHADTGVSLKGLQEIYNKGIGAYKTNPSSVRPNVKSKEQWAMARVYSAVMGGKASEVDANELKMELGGKIKKYSFVESTTTDGKKVYKLFDFVPTHKQVFDYYQNNTQKNKQQVTIIDSEIKIETFTDFDSDKFLKQANKVAIKEFNSSIDFNKSDLMFKFDKINLEVYPFEAKLKNGLLVKISAVDGVVFIEQISNKSTQMKQGGNIGLLAPNGKPSNLTAEQYKLVRTPSFKKWFGDWENDPKNASKIVDENGEPMMVYHGTNTNFNTFELNTAGKRFNEEGNTNSENGDYGMWGVGFYFSPIKKVSQRYGKKLMKLFLNIRNPFIRNPNLTGSNTEFKAVYGKIESLKLREDILSKGYDGVMHYEAGQKNQLMQIISFFPNQIKLADGKNTTFDKSNDDIRFENGGNIDKQDSVTMDIPLLIRTLELAREDVKSDAELHHVVENLLKLKNKKVLTMDDYNYIANVKEKHIYKMKDGGNVNEAEEKPNFETHLNTYLNNNGIKFEHHNAELEIYNQELELNRLLS